MSSSFFMHLFQKVFLVVNNCLSIDRSFFPNKKKSRMCEWMFGLGEFFSKRLAEVDRREWLQNPSAKFPGKGDAGSGSGCFPRSRCGCQEMTR